MQRDRAFYDRQAEQELRLAARAGSSDQRKWHLNKAAEYSTLSERVQAANMAQATS